ncbi:MAG: inositol-3-phosphate synthase [Phycisphaerae bacterium]|nr:inositol-3-phosphate synthase [Phycisphaerae bacterium]
MGKIRLAIVGVGNCSSSLIQGTFYYRNGRDLSNAGLLHPRIGPYAMEDIEVVAAFDVDSRKVGKDVSEAIFALPNCTKVFCSDVPKLGVTVQMGHVLDGVPAHMAEYPETRAFRVAEGKGVDVVKVLKEARADVLVSYLPVGSEEATRFYAEAALEAGCGMVNCVPVFIASDLKWGKRFKDRGLPIVGDDIKSQFGATITHRVLTKLFEDRGVKLERTYQLNTAGNTDFLNMLNRDRLKSKRISKTEAVQSQLTEPLDPQNIHIGPSDFIHWQDDNKVCFIRMEGRQFGDVPFNLELRLSVEDSPNSAGVAVDAIRCCKLAMDRGIGGPLTAISAFTMKHPPQQYADWQARELLEGFLCEKCVAEVPSRVETLKPSPAASAKV